MKIFLDNKRPFPEPKYHYECARDYETCVLLVSLFRNDIEIISLDYNLESEHSGFDVLVYMKENGIKPKAINIHSNHVFGVPKMLEYAREHFPDAEITQTPW